MHSKIAASTLALTGAIGLSVAGFVTALPATASAPVVIGGCPDGYQWLNVAQMEADGPYVLPGIVDRAGNSDGWVCGLQLPDSVAEVHCKKGGRVACELLELGLPFYLMRDDDVPGQAG